MTVRNDATRQIIPVREARPLRGVVARQGQVLLDTDVNEAERTLIDRVETADAAMLGPPDRLLYPAGTSGFAVSGTLANCTIAAGTGYLKGWQLANSAAATLLTQPNPWKGATPPQPAVVALKALVRHIDPVEDGALADVALGDAQASGRALNDWQAFLLPVPAGTTCPAVTGLTEWQALAAPSSGTLAFQIAAPAPSSDPCSLTPAGGHSRFENLLYRIEVHGGTAHPSGPTADGPRFRLNGLKLKLSRRNASQMAKITQINGVEITVSPPALDPRAWFEQGAYAEIVGPGDDIDPTAALAAERMFKVVLATDDVITLTGLPTDVSATGAQADGKWFLRLWDAWPGGVGTWTVPAGGGPIDLGDGIAIKLAGGASGTFRRGDYWTAAVRADGSVAWPGIDTVSPTQSAPHGPEIRYAPLAIISAAAIEDCRIPFATLSDRALLYRGGDGQQAFAPVATAPTPIALALKLRVAVMRGATPVPGAKVRWRVPTGGIASWIEGGSIAGAPHESTTGPDGLAEVTWAIDAQQQAAAHAVEAVLLDNGQPASTPAVRFGAQFATAAKTSYLPGDCPTLATTTDVQAALDALCKALDEREPDTIRLERITLLDDKNKPLELIKEKLIHNALEVEPRALAGGIRFGFDPAMFELGVKPFDPLAEIAIDIPYPATDYERLGWRRSMQGSSGGGSKPFGSFGFQTIRLDGLIDSIDDNEIFWKPTGHARKFLLDAPTHRFGSIVFDGDLKNWKNPPLDRVLCRIRLRSALIFAEHPETKKRIWLNAEHLGTKDVITGRELMLDERDPQRAGDLDMFIYLTLPESGIIFYYPKGATTPHRSNLGTIQDGMKAVLAKFAPGAASQVQLKAYADEPGTAAVNMRLSQQRAEKLRQSLVQQGIPANAITQQAFGNTESPHPPLMPEAEESLNRRVEVLIESQR